MKKTLSIILPSMIILVITLWGRAEKNILLGLFLLFPIIFVIQGIMYSDFKKELLLGFILSSIAFIVPLNLMYNMRNCIDLLIVYNMLGIGGFLVKKKIYSGHS
ncbi:hypothetical protein IR152_18700 [Clostridioides sp. ES-S-0108-01]|uniref:hypothetical protein n=1 Tax=unclassified Clostridioides TaxID=2635829 RepID=UPI001D0CA8E3|nr:hypothetical protein [Clostridioides sp. ES-S-0107-01]MCC0785034.1 hypothetical protein [Clostridioides sp. ES-S-0108-01]UDN52991.1 hypothetical protein JJC16_18715 [Clostridioides sp. ES-S-0107-01]